MQKGAPVHIGLVSAQREGVEVIVDGKKGKKPMGHCDGGKSRWWRAVLGVQAAMGKKPRVNNLYK